MILLIKYLEICKCMVIFYSRKMKFLVGCILFTIFSESSTTYVINIEDFILRNGTDSKTENDESFSSINIFSFVRKYGFPLEEHTVTTDDGYILTLHRIPYGKTNTQKDNRPPILLNHCFLGTSAVFVMLGPNISLAFQLAEAGYDVWLGNIRGNTYSKKHTTLDPSKNASFWDFSFHEHGYYDVPAMIDYVINETNRKQLSYLGYSQGTAQFFAMASTRPEYNDKINIMTALAPIAYLEHATHPLLKLVKRFSSTFEGILLRDNVNEFLAHNNFLNFIADRLCANSHYTEICALATFVVVGFDSPELDRSTIPKMLDVLPGGGSLKQIIHFLQELFTPYFRQYDYGIIGNKARYGQRTPPDYDVTKITAPVALFYSENDILASVKDVERLAKELPKSEKHLLSYKMFTHLDYVMAKDLKSLLHYDLINTLNAKNGLAPVSSTVPSTTDHLTSPVGPSDATTQKPVTTTEGSGFSIKYSILTIVACFTFTIFLIY